MGRVLLVSLSFVLGSSAASAQNLSTLHITATFADATGRTTPVAGHALLISDEPPSAPPRRIFTTPAGTADVSLSPGRYAVESDRPVLFGGKRYEWSRRVDIVAGRDATLALTADNASVDAGTAADTSPTSSGTDPSVLAAQWQESVVGLWTPTRHASGFVVDARGLVITSQRAIGAATSAEAQFAPDVRVRATVVASDPVRDVAILWVNPSVVSTLRQVPLGCGQTTPPVTNRQELFAIGAGMTGRRHLTPGSVTGVGPRLLVSDLTLTRASAGGPVFTTLGLIGFTTIEDRDPDARSDARIVRIDQACELMAAAEKKIVGAMPPDATPLPPEPRLVAVGALSEAVTTRTGGVSPYTMSTTDFDITFITPVHIYGAKDQVQRRVMDFGPWSEYFADYPRALVVRVTPKMAEGLWAKVGRAAAMTQGVSLPSIKRAKAGFSRMRAFCGDVEVTPVHPFVVEHRVSEAEVIDEGLYVFDAAGLGPSCSAARLTVYSEKEPQKGDTRVVDENVLQQIARDFASL